MEKELGTKLVERTGRFLEVTEAGSATSIILMPSFYCCLYNFNILFILILYIVYMDFIFFVYYLVRQKLKEM